MRRKEGGGKGENTKRETDKNTRKKHRRKRNKSGGDGEIRKMRTVDGGSEVSHREYKKIRAKKRKERERDENEH